MELNNHLNDNFDDLIVTTKEQEERILQKVFRDAEDVVNGRVKTIKATELRRMMKIWKKELEDEEP
jgi:hypothetical protein